MKSKLSIWLRAAPLELRQDLADACDTSVIVLYSIASGRRGNPTLHRAMVLTRKIKDLNDKYSNEYGLPDVTLDDLFEEAKRYVIREK